MSINNSPEADIYVPMTREEAASNNYSMNTDQTNTNNQNDDVGEHNSSGSNMISNVLNEVNTFIDSLEDSPPLFAPPPPPSSLPPSTKDVGYKNYKDGAHADGAPKTNINNMPPPPPSYEAATSSYSIADELNNLHIDRIHSDLDGTGVECNICPPSSLTSLAPPPQTSSTTVTTALTQPQTALTKAKDDDKEDAGMIHQSEELFTSLSNRYQQHQQQRVKPDSFEDENHIGNVVIGTSTTTKSEEIEDNDNVIKASEELYNKILQEEQQALDVKDNTAATDEVAEVTKASEELYNKINSNIINSSTTCGGSDSITAMESYSVCGEESIDISVTATKNNNSEKTSQFNWNKEVPRSQRRSSSSSYRQVSSSSSAATALPPSVSSEQVQKKNTATTSTPVADQVVEEKSSIKVHEPSSNLQPRVANPTTQKVLSPFSSKARRVIHTL